MKTIKIKSQQQMLLPGLIILFIFCLSILNVWGCMPDKDLTVKKAFELRMEGKVDEALALIDVILEEDSTYALANFEKYRILGYMLLGGADIDMNWDEVITYIGKAAAYDPENVTLAYEKAIATFLKAYITMEQGEGDAKEAVGAIANDFKYVLKLQPDHPQALLYLVEIYSQLPPDMGGDPEKAREYADLLEKSDEYYAAKAELMLNPQDELAFWLEYAENHDRTIEVLQEIGTAYIYEEDPFNAEKFYREAIEMDNSKNILLLNLARYYQFLAMTGEAKPDSVLPLSANFIDMYLGSEPAPIIPLKAYAMGMKVKVLMFTGKKDEGQELMAEAKALDPYLSRAFAIPGPGLFEAPDKIKPHYASFFKPF